MSSRPVPSHDSDLELGPAFVCHGRPATSTFNRRRSLLKSKVHPSRMVSSKKIAPLQKHDHAPTIPFSSDPLSAARPSFSSTCSPVSFQPIPCAGPDVLKFACTCQTIVKGDQDSLYTWRVSYQIAEPTSRRVTLLATGRRAQGSAR